MCPSPIRGISFRFQRRIDSSQTKPPLTCTAYASIHGLPATTTALPTSSWPPASSAQPTRTSCSDHSRSNSSSLLHQAERSEDRQSEQWPVLWSCSCLWCKFSAWPVGMSLVYSLLLQAVAMALPFLPERFDAGDGLDPVTQPGNLQK